MVGMVRVVAGCAGLDRPTEISHRLDLNITSAYGFFLNLLSPLGDSAGKPDRNKLQPISPVM